MKKEVMRRYEMLVRVTEFGSQHRDQFPDTSAGAAAFAAVAAAAAQMGAQDRSRQMAGREGRHERRKARQALSAQLMAIARTARVVAKTVPDADVRFALPRTMSDVERLSAARGFLENLEPVKASMVAHGLRETFITDLQAATDAFDQAFRSSEAVKTNVAGARAGVAAAAADGLDAVRSLDVIIANTWPNDATLLASWKRARREDRRTPGADGENTPPPAPPVDVVLPKAS